ncbi:divergent polysaccharide deacetylase family protein [Bosea sp. (in: a-proteobacteria)]|uniref:divergent polysaccharide deacetylase family protein n=1 Tax=Bosea sp. (in: a-proteobacteria) TaxID=1871050 RepID=UPI0026252EF0|nr:divergent polysaccharide deacetylase family protein [Bosea sp. (in: a-proteobacteria)]MCO5089693.1 divergent polysaccharide deacetylase family protein [Bosea sp. (in: a-proteobacteria)]
MLGLLLTVALNRDPDGGEPIAVAAIGKRAAPAPALPAGAATAGPATDAPRQPASAAELENSAGVTVFRPGEEAPGAIVITVPDEAGPIRLAPAPDSRLVERSRYGLLPKLGPDGATPAKVYARPFGPEPMVKPAGRIALLVGGLGISQSGTAEAIAKLPPPVSLAFAPYGAELERSVQRARGEGHEVFLQVPMEPFDYPDNDPGPHTLLTGPKASENLDKLHWALGRFTGYVGIVNFLGGRFTADENALSPVLRELAGRGVMVVDDGSSARSLLAGAADRARIPALKIDRVIDGVANADAIDKELAALESLAREQGIAVAAASALPVSIERINRWAQSLEGKKLAIVPVSAARGFRQSKARETPKTTEAPKTTGSLR